MNPVVVWYTLLVSKIRRAGGFSVRDLDQSIARASSLPTSRLVMRGMLLDIEKGRGACPHCRYRGPHRSNKHHRFARLAFSCGACSKTFKATEIKE